MEGNLWPDKILPSSMRTRALRGALAQRGYRSYVSGILRLALLAPDIVEAILAGRADQALMLERLERPLPMSWEDQRAHFVAHSQLMDDPSTHGRSVHSLRHARCWLTRKVEQTPVIKVSSSAGITLGPLPGTA